MKEIVVVLDNVRSALNVGAIFRTCDGAAVKKLHLIGITPYPPHTKVKKTALGAEEFVPWEYHRQALEVIAKYKAEGYTLAAIEQTSYSIPFASYAMPEKIAFIFGHEITGVDPDILQRADVSLELPMLGKKNSLNVATTVGIVLYSVRMHEHTIV